MFLAAIHLIGVNTDSRLNIGFVEQAQQRFAVMAIGRGGFNRQLPSSNILNSSNPEYAGRLAASDTGA